ncbi:SPOSA6832_00697 [Sporobolomyces salmonicolor]|uniref:SPOSA6832_00697-mRNA-1:cds n=1 Tax=Sporidiobolus salmonicolor TaxID=5005 RepID=A0A0D6EGX8_SPOSA|nr:SPOSA6832_00697 [Sporobolomyces salmonicolor]
MVATPAALAIPESTASPPSSTAKRPRATALLDSFTTFRSELDAHQAQRERIVKLSRDITALSKQMIFALHRVATGRKWSAVKKDAEGKMAELRTLFERLRDEVQGENFWRYERSISPGIQEYLEGFTFYYYLEHRTLPTLAEAQASLLPPPPAQTTSATSADSPSIESTATEPTSPAVPQPQSPEELAPYVHVSGEDYLGGVADLTGELMRLAIASVGKNLSDSLGGSNKEGDEEFANIDNIGRLVREIKGQMDPLAPYARWLGKKLFVLDQSLGKIENASYNLRIRGAEYKDSPKMLQEFARKMAMDSGPQKGGEDVAAA